MNGWRAETYNGLFCIPLLAIGVMALVDALGSLVLFVSWAWSLLS